MLEPKMRKELDDPIVLAKRDAAMQWCANASAYAAAHVGKSWSYLLIPHDAIAENITIYGLAKQFGCRAQLRNKVDYGLNPWVR